MFAAVLASNRCAEILSRQMTKRLEVSSPSSANAYQSASSVGERDSLSSGVVLCPQKHRDAAWSFTVDMLRKLIKLALQAHRHRSPRLDICSRVISEMLVGNVLLQALQEAQKHSSSKKATTATEEELGGAMQDESLSFGTHSSGLLNSLPPTVQSQAIFEEVDNATNFFLLLEDYLCSKEMAY